MSRPSIPFVCAWCQRTRTGTGQWTEVDVEAPEPAEATHGICPDCLAQETQLACAGIEAR